MSALLAAPVGWLVIAYLGSLLVLFVAAFWRLDPFTAEVIRDYSFSNFQTLWDSPVYRDIALRTIAIAAAVTLIDAVVAFPIAFYMAKVASPRTRSLLVVAILMPLWASYLVKVYAWRIILQDNGPLNWLLEPFGLTGPGFGNVAGVLVFSYLWLPYMILPLYAGLERIPDSLLEASSDLGGKAGRTFRRVILPLAAPGIIAGCILVGVPATGEYVIPAILGGEKTLMLGNVIADQFLKVGDYPFGAAMAMSLMVLLTLILVVARARLRKYEEVV